MHTLGSWLSSNATLSFLLLEWLTFLAFNPVVAMRAVAPGTATRLLAPRLATCRHMTNTDGHGIFTAGVSSARVAAINDNIRRTGYICIEDACGNPSKAADSHAMQVVVLADGKQPPAAELSPSSSELDLQEVPAGPKVPAYYQVTMTAVGTADPCCMHVLMPARMQKDGLSIE